MNDDQSGKEREKPSRKGEGFFSMILRYIREWLRTARLGREKVATEGAEEELREDIAERQAKNVSNRLAILKREQAMEKCMRSATIQGRRLLQEKVGAGWSN